MAGTRKNVASDLTGRQAEAAAKARDEKIAKDEAEKQEAAAAAADAVKNSVIDLTQSKSEESKADDTSDDSDIEILEVAVEAKPVSLRVNESFSMTYAGTTYDMEPGPTYQVPAEIAEWLEERHVVWH